MKRPLVRGGVALVLFAALAVGGYTLWKSQQPSASEVHTVTVQSGDIEDAVSALGTLQPLEYVDVGAQISGQLKRILVNVGDQVTQGALIAEIDPVVQTARVEADKAQLRALQAQLADKQAQAKQADLQYRRQVRLKKQDATSQEEFEAADTLRRSAAAQVNLVKAQIDETTSTLQGDEAQLGFTKIYAPLAGTVVSVTARQGMTLNANQQAPILLRIADLSTMTVWTQVSEADVTRLKVGMDAYFSTLGAPDRRWAGKLRQILPTPEMVNNVVLYTALFDVANPKLELLTQMTAQVFFVVGSAEGVTMAPLSALRASRKAEGVYHATVLSADGTQQRREVKLGVTNRTMAEVVSGLEPGDRLVIDAPRADNAARAQAQNRGNLGGMPRLAGGR